MRAKYPQYRLIQWLDTSPGWMDKPEAAILFGVQCKEARGAVWLNVAIDGKAAIYPTADQASSVIDALRANGSEPPAD